MLSRNNRKKGFNNSSHNHPESVVFIAPYSEKTTSEIELTKSHFLDAYSKGKWNLSEISHPSCMEKDLFMKPPESYNEFSRCQKVQQYIDKTQWGEKSIFKRLAGGLRKQFNVNGISISLITDTKVVFKYECSLNMNEVNRFVTIDGHAILSKDYFLLLDASKDWRTAGIPFVTGIPFIKFYCGVPLLTSKKEPIGILAVFDSFAKREFSLEQIESLKAARDEIMQILESTEDQLSKQYGALCLTNRVTNLKCDDKLNELNELKMKLGRATSRGSLMTVFEKDGSGGPYIQNQNFKFLTKLSNEQEKQEFSYNQNLKNNLLKAGSIKKASNVLCKILCNHYKVDFVYILELRISKSYQIAEKYLPKENKVDSETFQYNKKLIKDSGKENVFMSRIMGSFGSKHNSLNFENLIHQQSFETEFGLHYRNKEQNAIYNNGILMPFYRHNSKLVRQNKLRPQRHSNDEITNLFLRSGGYIIGLFNERFDQDFSAEVKSRIYGNVCVLRKLYISG